MINEKVFDYNLEMFNLAAVPFTCNKRSCKVGQIISWNMNARFFPKELQDKNIRLKYFKNIVEDVGLDDLVMPDQPNSDKLIEDCHEITFEDFKNYYESDTFKEEKSIWNIPKNYNAIFMKREVSDKIKEVYKRDVSLVFPAADCAVVRFYDREKEVIGLTHSDAKITTYNIIGKMTEYMKEHFNSNIDQLIVYVGAFAHDDWIYNGMPSFALLKDEIFGEIGKREWSSYIEELGNNKYKINYGDKIYDQLVQAGISSNNIYFDSSNTLYDKDYYSHSRSVLEGEHEGRNLIGITFSSDKLVKNSQELNVKLR